MSELADTWKEIEEHCCGSRMILSCDDPRNRCVGWVCVCGKAWTATIDTVRKEAVTHPEYGILFSPEGRVRLAARLNGPGALIIWNERLET